MLRLDMDVELERTAAEKSREGLTIHLLRRSASSLAVTVVNSDKDVARMVARYAGASLGLLAFTIAVFGGLVTRNPFSVTLSRGILALFVFCLIGLVLGHLAQMVVSEHARKREAEIRARFAAATAAAGVSPAAGSSSAVGAGQARS